MADTKHAPTGDPGDHSLLVVTPPHVCDPQLAIAAARAGAVGLLDLGLCQENTVRESALRNLRQFVGNRQNWGVAWDVLAQAERMPECLKGLDERRWPWLLLAGLDFESVDLRELLRQGREVAERIIVEAYGLDDALAAQAAGCDGVVLKGQEAGGRTGRQAMFILLQRVRDRLTVPYWARGAISPQTAAAAVFAGATGVVLGEQLWLTAESPFSTEQREAWANLDGSETVLLGDDRQAYRFFSRCGRATLQQLASLQQSGQPWLEPLRQAMLQGQATGERPNPATLISLGEEIAFAAELARRHVTTAGVLGAFRQAMRESPSVAARQSPLSEDSPLAKQHATRYPIVQGPMSRVSDVAAFGQAVAEHGAMPVFALGLMRGAEVQGLLEDAKTQLGERPWGVGLLGFAPEQLRREQLEVVRPFRPALAVVAGGRPSQVTELEAAGTACYLHVPSPRLLEAFIHDGARKFILEGRECGGHVGPRSSFTLWGAAIDVLLKAEIDNPAEFQILFAGGIHDAHSAAMVAVMAAPLVERGMKIGVLVGTGYLRTEEAVATGAITPEFQRQVLACRQTILLESGIGHASRCAITPFAEQFQQRRKQLIAGGTEPEQVRVQLEMLNLGRLRVAAKGLKRASAEEQTLVEVDQQEQRRDGLFMLGEVATLVDRPQPMAALHEGICHGSSALLRQRAAGDQAAAPSGEQSPGEPLAIVGISCLLPGSEDFAQFWGNVLAKRSAIGEVPADRWDASVFYNPARGTPDQTYSKWGAFLGQVRFDPFAYHMPPAVLRSIEPIQLLSLEVARRALEDAGGLRGDFPRERTAVLFGTSGPHEMGMAYAFRTMLRQRLAEEKDLPAELREDLLRRMEQRLPPWTEDSFAGFLNNVIAGRISNCLDLRGPNFVVDAACASSLAAVHTAAEMLRSGACDAALVGGADATNNPCGFMSFTATHALSPRGKSAPFDEGADGIVLGEGVAAIVLKRLADAERDGDRIYAVLRGIGASSDGRNRSLTAPHPPGQLAALRRAYADAGVSPSRVELIEAHGTGTAVGDRAEIESLEMFFAGHDLPPQQCAVGSVKSMIGHAKAAAGVIGLIKAAAALQQRVLPPTSNVEKPNGQIDFARSPCYINTETRPWLRRDPQQPRTAGVSAFGFGGTNFHVVLQEYTGDYHPGQRLDLAPRPAEIFLFAAASPAQLAEDLKQLDQQLEQTPEVNLAQLAYSVLLDIRRRSDKVPPGGCRLTIVASDLPDLRGKIGKAVEQLPNKAAFEHRSGIYYYPAETPPKVAFVVPGQGAQRINMLKDLLGLHPEAIAILEQADRQLEPLLGQRLSDAVYPVPVFSDAERAAQQAALDQSRLAQPALSAAGLVALHVLRRFGLRADMTAGHSHGEYTALHLAGCLSAQDLLRLSTLRGASVSRLCQHAPGAMAAVFANAKSTQAALEELHIPAAVANINAPNNTVIAGPVAAIERALEELPRRKMHVRRIPVTGAFHTPAVQPVADEIAPVIAAIPIAPPQIPVYSNVTSEPYPAEPAHIRTLMGDQAVSQVRFVEQIERMYQDGARVFIEMGPGNIVTNYVSRILQDKPHHAIPLEMSGREGGLQLAHLLAQCAALGVSVDLRPWFVPRRLRDQGVADCLAAARVEAQAAAKAWIVDGKQVRPPQGAATAKAKPATKSSGTATSAVPANTRHNPQGSFAMSTPTTAGTNGSSHSAKDSMLFRPSNGNGKVVGSTPDAKEGAANGNGSSAQAAAPAMADAGLPPAVDMATGQAPLAGAAGSEALAQFQATMAQWLAWQQQQQQAGCQFLAVQEQFLRTLTGAAPGPVVTGPGMTVPSPWRSSPVPNGPRFSTPSAGSGATAAQADVPSAAKLPSAGFAPRRVMPAAVAARVHAAPSAAGPSPRLAARVSASAPLSSTPPDELLLRPSATASPEAVQHCLQASSGTQAVPTTEEFRRDLLEVTSQRTGYPLEMLEEDLLLEADLGIDSIKRIEIFNGLKKYYSFMQLTKQSEEQILNTFTGLKTLGDIVRAFDRQRAEYLGNGKSPEAAVQAPVAALSQETPRPFDQAVPAAPAEELPPPAPEPSHPDAPQTTNPVERFVLRPRPTPLPPDTKSAALLPAGQTMLVLGEVAGWDPSWTSALTDGQQAVCHVLPGPQAARLAEDRFTADLTSADSLSELHQLLVGAGVRVGGILNLLGLQSPGEDAGAKRPDENDAPLRLLQSLLNVAKEFQGELRQCAGDGGGRLINVTSLGGTFGIGQRGPLPLAQAASLGFFKSLRHEWPELRVKNIDLDLESDPAALQADLRREILSGDNALEVGLGPAGRQTLELTAAPIQPIDGPGLGSDAVILITGGARGITAEVAEALGRQYRCRLILVGRTPEPGEEEPEWQSLPDEKSLRSHLIACGTSSGQPVRPAEINRQVGQIVAARQLRASLAALRASGAQVEYQTVDVRDRVAFSKLVEGVYDRYGRIDGVIHGAGVIEDSRIPNKTAESAARVFRTKVDGAQVLAATLRPEGLKFLVLFSSVAGRFGNAGQADYAAANEYLNKLAGQLDAQWPGRVVAINWGPWEGGMVPTLVAEQFQARGIRLIPRSQGVAACVQEVHLGKGHPAEVVLGCNLPALERLAKGEQ